MKRIQLFRYIAAVSDRLFRNACMKTAIKLSRLLKSMGAGKTAASLLEGAYMRFPVGARGDFGQKDLHIFGPEPEALISEFAAYLKQHGRDHGLAPEHQPAQDSLKAQELMRSRRIFDPVSLSLLAFSVWAGLLTFAAACLALFFLFRGGAGAVRAAGIIFFSFCAAVFLLWRLREGFLSWMTMSLFYAASRKLERDHRS